ncbi:segregation/condensation protein A [Daejeonella sp. H1SJ63]|jgi:segregation and condensation protein A|uniref:segregation and condensation protein A n=1 Tax=Daejeonella sp. H1SJ63 TaxID=3034145 RepID=UPI0023ED3046|nr:segregation/condensation protein A [Daejeonella sp. H1SJ63]
MNSDINFEIHLPQFEGPFDLLLFFIERDELDIQDVPIARITDDFLGYIHKMNALNIELASEFIFVAATLMRIKAKMLLPRPDLDEEGNEIDLKRDLIRKLIEYKKFKQLAEHFRLLEEERFKREKRGNISYDLQQLALVAGPGEELESFNLYKLMLTYHRILQRGLQRDNRQEHVVVQYPYNIEAQKEVIDRLLSINKRLDFKDLLKNSDNKVHFVYNFLAMLEMLQQDLISIQTGMGFNNFWIESKMGSIKS